MGEAAPAAGDCRQFSFSRERRWSGEQLRAVRNALSLTQRVLSMAPPHGVCPPPQVVKTTGRHETLLAETALSGERQYNEGSRDIARSPYQTEIHSPTNVDGRLGCQADVSECLNWLGRPLVSQDCKLLEKAKMGGFLKCGGTMQRPRFNDATVTWPVDDSRVSRITPVMSSLQPRNHCMEMRLRTTAGRPTPLDSEVFHGL